MDLNNFIVIISCIILIGLIGIIFKMSFWKILKLIFNSILGGILIYFINLIGTEWGLHIGLNIVTSVFVGLCGIPGAVLLLVLKII